MLLPRSENGTCHFYSTDMNQSQGHSQLQGGLGNGNPPFFKQLQLYTTEMKM